MQLGMLPLVWLALGLTILITALLAQRSSRALLVGRLALAVLYLGAGAAVNAVFLARGDDYSGFADLSYLPFVRETWRSLVAPNQVVFISLLIAFEAAVGILVLIGGRWAEIGMIAAVAFHVALLSFGWWYYAWSIPMVVALILLLRARRRWSVQRGARSRPTSTAELRPPRVA